MGKDILLYKENSKEEVISVSVILCTYSPSFKLLKRILIALFNQKFIEEKFEIIIVINNPSFENIFSKINRLYKKVNYNVRVNIPVRILVEPRIGLSYARNTGIRNAEGDIVIFIDDDMIPSYSWMYEHLNIYKKYPDAVVVGGDIKGIWEELLPEWLVPEIQLTLSVFHLYDDVTRLENSWLFGGNISFKKEILNRIGYFNTGLGRKGYCLLSCEETEFTYRIYKNRIGSQYYNPYAYVYHFIPKRRMTKEFNKDRWYWQGISDFYFDLICYNKKMLIKRWSLNFLGCFNFTVDLIYSFIDVSKKRERFLYELECLRFIGYSTSLIKIVISKTIKLIVKKFFQFVRKVRNKISVFTRFYFSPKPKTLHYEITYRCSCKCKFCSRWEVGPLKYSEELSTEEAINMISQAKKLGVTEIYFSGGEPFIRKDIFEIASFCKKIGLSTGVTTNGTLVTKDNIDEIISLFDHISISIDSCYAEEHDEIRGVQGIFDKAIQSLMLLPLERRIVQCLITSRNINYLPDIVKYFNKLGAKVIFQPIHHNSSGLLILSDSNINTFGENIDKEWIEILNTLQKMGLEIGGKFCRYYGRFWKERELLKKEIKCYMGSASFFVDPYGNVIPCEEFRIPMGNIRKISLMEIWKSPKFRNFRIKYNLYQKNRPCVCLYNCVETVL